jgi:hypothetical protein
LKILWAITVLRRAGAETSLVNIAPALLRCGFELHVAVVRPPYDLAPELEAIGVRVHRWNCRATICRALSGDCAPRAAGAARCAARTPVLGRLRLRRGAAYLSTRARRRLVSQLRLRPVSSPLARRTAD